MSFPLLTLVLPGTWLQVPLDDEVRVARVVELVEDSGADLEAVEALRATLGELAAAGGDQLFFRQATAEPTVLVTAWPFGGEPPGGTELARTDGYVVLRDTGTASSLVYWITHPSTGRVLVVTVSFYGRTVDPTLYDVLATTLAWDDEVTADA